MTQQSWLEKHTKMQFGKLMISSELSMKGRVAGLH